MDVDGVADMSEYESIPFYIGHHERDRKEVVDEDILHHAEDLGVSCVFYDELGIVTHRRGSTTFSLCPSRTKSTVFVSRMSF